MKLPYDKKDMVRILDSDNFSVATFNNVVKRFIMNDLKFQNTSGNVPGTWENRWYNSPEDTSLGYMAGDAVWINCYGTEKFVQEKWNDIESYVQQNGVLQAEYLELKQLGDRAEMAKFFGKVVLGHSGNPPLFYLGDINSPIQIRISLVDNNMFPPKDEYTKSDENTDKVYWKNFFTSSSKAEIVSQIFEYFRESQKKRLEQHEDEFHLDGLEGPEAFMQNHMHVDFQNAVYKQKMKSHYWFDKKLEKGFDTVSVFSCRKLDSGGTQWFRLWRSGYLEHGGTIGMADAMDQTSGIQTFDERFIRVNFGWKYERNQKTAPIFDFPTDLLNRVYSGSTDIDIGSSMSNSDGNVKTQFQTPKMGQAYKYSVVVNAILSDNDTDWNDRPSPFSNPSDYGRLKYYSTKDIFDQQNDGFSIVVNSYATRYSYYAAGFTTRRK